MGVGSKQDLFVVIEYYHYKENISVYHPFQVNYKHSLAVWYSS
jgi:hypothetical protein